MVQKCLHRLFILTPNHNIFMLAVTQYECPAEHIQKLSIMFSASLNQTPRFLNSLYNLCSLCSYRIVCTTWRVRDALYYVVSYTLFCFGGFLDVYPAFLRPFNFTIHSQCISIPRCDFFHPTWKAKQVSLKYNLCDTYRSLWKWHWVLIQSEIENVA